MKHTVFDERKCQLGEGPFWHPERKELFWFDILNQKLLCATGEWDLPRAASAAGWIDKDTLLLATSVGLEVFDLATGRCDLIKAVEAEIPRTRSNDGRTDPLGGFWFSTMGWDAETRLGSIYRYADGEVQKRVDGMTIPNAICFSPCANWVYFADTPAQKILRRQLDPVTGWPVQNPTLFVDLSAKDKNPDGAVTDSHGNLWVAMWGSAELLGFSPEGRDIGSIALPTPNVTCPATAGPGSSDIYVTTAFLGLPQDAATQEDPAGKTFLIKEAFQGHSNVPVRIGQQHSEPTP